MFKKNVLVALFKGVFFLSLSLSAGEAKKTSDIVYKQDFESDSVRVEFFSKDRMGYIINYNGLTEECAYSGKKSYKLDISFKERMRLIAVFYVKIPAEGLDRFSGYMRTDAESTGKPTLGVSFAFPPTRHNMCTVPHSLCKTVENGWILCEIGGLYKEASRMASGILERDDWGIHEENVGKELEAIIINFNAKAGERFVVYVDDLNVTGKVPEPLVYRKELKENWSPVLERTREQINRWTRLLSDYNSRYEKIGGLTGIAEEIRKEALEKNNALTDKFSNMLKKETTIEKEDYHENNRILKQQEYLCENLDMIEDKQDFDYICYTVPSPTDSRMILPQDKIVSARISSQIEISACRNEFEPASFVIQALSDMSSVSIEFSDLKNNDGPGIITKSHLQVNTVKCWYQAGTAWLGIQQDRSRRKLVPELLLHDDTLVKVDYENKRNFLKLRFPEGEKYVCVSDVINVEGVKTPDEFPVSDTKMLQPVDIPAGTNKQFWITLKIPVDAIPGDYAGTAIIKAKGVQIGTVGLNVKVLSFELSEPYYISSIDYHSTLDKKGCTTASKIKTKEQFKADLKNMMDHGITNCQHYFSVNEKSLREVLELRREVGMSNKTLYLKGVSIRNFTDEKSLEEIKRRVRNVISIAKEYGTEKVYFYGIDEVQGDLLVSQRAAWNAVHEAGGKIFVAGAGDNVELMGDIQDICVRSGWPKKDEVSRWHAYEHKIFSYANPQIGVENPEVYRRNFGLLLWKYKYDGAADNAFQHSFGNIWNDFSHPIYRAHSIVYPTIDGGIKTIAWEGYREGVDDVRYMTTLEKAVKTVEKSENISPEKRQKLDEAKKFISDLRNSDDIENKNLDDLRREISKHIIAITASK